jgi:hypothetical protein
MTKADFMRAVQFNSIFILHILFTPTTNRPTHTLGPLAETRVRKHVRMWMGRALGTKESYILTCIFALKVTYLGFSKTFLRDDRTVDLDNVW